MRSNPGKASLIISALALATFFPSLTGCSGCGSGADTAGMDSTATGAGAAHGHDDATGAEHGTNGSTGTTTGHGSDTVGHMDSRTTSVASGNSTATLLTATEERTKTGEEMRGLRAILKAELDGIRASLGKGGTDVQKEANKVRAAELAQGLERIDRAIKAIDEADDVSWGTIRESQLKEAGEVRAWMTKYGMKVNG